MSGTSFPLILVSAVEDRRIQAGEPWDLALTVGGTASIDHVAMDVRPEDQAEPIVSFRLLDPPTDSGTVTVSGRTVTLHLASSVTAPLIAGRYEYDLFLTLDGRETRLLYGPAVVVGKVTDPL